MYRVLISSEETSSRLCESFNSQHWDRAGQICGVFYDCDNDVLLESSEMPFITSQGGLKSTFLALWLVLNFKYFCLGITKGMVESGLKSGFLDLVGGEVNYYGQVTTPCVCPSMEQESLWMWGPPQEKEESADRKNCPR